MQCITCPHRQPCRACIFAISCPARWRYGSVSVQQNPNYIVTFRASQPVLYGYSTSSSISFVVFVPVQRYWPLSLIYSGADAAQVYQTQVPGEGEGTSRISPVSVFWSRQALSIATKQYPSPPSNIHSQRSPSSMATAAIARRWTRRWIRLSVLSAPLAWETARLIIEFSGWESTTQKRSCPRFKPRTSRRCVQIASYWSKKMQLPQDTDMTKIWKRGRWSVVFECVQRWSKDLNVLPSLLEITALHLTSERVPGNMKA